MRFAGAPWLTIWRMPVPDSFSPLFAVTEKVALGLAPLQTKSMLADAVTMAGDTWSRVPNGSASAFNPNLQLFFDGMTAVTAMVAESAMDNCGRASSAIAHAPPHRLTNDAARAIAA